MPQSHAQTIAANVRAEVARQLVTQAEIAGRLDLTQHGVSRRMRGTVEFSAIELQRLAALLGVPVADLLGDEAVSA